MKSSTTAESFRIANHEVAPGTRQRLKMRVASDVTGSDMVLPVEVLHGRQAGPRLFISAAIHGDEINGVEIIRRVLKMLSVRRLRGSVIAVPIVNVFGFIGHSRYLPDRRDLNRSFPGSTSGSLASRLAYTFLKEVAERSTHGIDLHTAAVHRKNLPHVRACLGDEQTLELARAFGTPLVVNANLRDGSLRAAVAELGIPILVYEGGEALRFDETSIRAGVRGVRAVMKHLGMLAGKRSSGATLPLTALSTTWVRASVSGIVRLNVQLGNPVEEGDRLAVIAGPLGARETTVTAPKKGVVIGKAELPLVNEGDALIHLAIFDRPETAATKIERFQEEMIDPSSVEDIATA